MAQGTGLHWAGLVLGSLATHNLGGGTCAQPARHGVYGGLIGESQLNSIDAPPTKHPAAIITSSSYPGIAQGKGVTWLSTGDAHCIF